MAASPLSKWPLVEKERIMRKARKGRKGRK